MTDTTASRPGWLRDQAPRRAARPVLALVCTWSYSQPERIGEVALLPTQVGTRLLGRGTPQADDPASRVEWLRQRPGDNERCGPLQGSGMSRRQMLLRPKNRSVEVEQLGRAALTLNGTTRSRASATVGDVIEVEGEWQWLVVERPPKLDPLRHRQPAEHDFGMADPNGVVGESIAAWELRDRIAFAADRVDHVLIVGPSGVGKELAACALHQRSPRREGKLVARNAATLPDTLVDAELFGNVAGYPNATMQERPGMVGEANGGTLFFDEIGELKPELQTHLLRVLDSGGEYQRLGDARQRRSDFRMVAATNRPESDLKGDLAARFVHRVEISGLNERREDIALLTRHLILQAAREDEQIAATFVANWDGVSGQPRLAPNLMQCLLRHNYGYHVRELSNVLWRSIASSRGNHLQLTDEVARILRTEEPTATVESLDPTHVQQVLDNCGGNQAQAYRRLGLKNRDVLYRFIKKHGLEVRRP